MPTLDRIAKTINGPNESQHIGEHKLHELQDLKWGQLKSQDKAQYLRAAGFVKALFDNDPEYYNPEGLTDRSNGAQGATRPPPLPRMGATPPPLPLPAPLPADPRSTEHLLQQFRAFASRNAMTWLSGAGDHHHPIWADVATELDMYDLNFEPKEGPDYAYIQPLNRKPYTVLLEEYIDMHNERDATDRGG